MAKPTLEEGIDYYLENGLFVLTARYLTNRGYCCKNRCRHCPYGFTKPQLEVQHTESALSTVEKAEQEKSEIAQ